MPARGEEFINRLQDGRKVWINGQQVDVVSHSAFKGTLETIRQLFDSLNDPASRDRTGFISPETKQYVHQSFSIPNNVMDLQKKRIAYEDWAVKTCGSMSRLSDYARSRLTGWYMTRNEMAAYDAHYSAKMGAYFQRARDENRFLTIVQRDPQIDRYKQNDVNFKGETGFLSITKKTEEGIYVNGAKMIATAAPYTDDFIISPGAPLTEEKKNLAHMLIVPAGSKGLHIICREPYSAPACEKEDYPLSSCYDEMDALLVFDNCFIPWDLVLLHDHPEAVWAAKMNVASNSLGYHQAIIRFKVKLEFITAIACKIADMIGAKQFLHVQEKLGELIMQVRTIESLILSSEYDFVQQGENIIPNFKYIETARNLGATYYPRALEIMQLIGAGGFIQMPSSTKDFASPIQPFLEKYLQGNETTAQEKVKVFKLAWDLVGSSFASRHELYERFYSGDPIRNKAIQYQNFDYEPLYNMFVK